MKLGQAIWNLRRIGFILLISASMSASADSSTFNTPPDRFWTEMGKSLCQVYFEVPGRIFNDFGFKNNLRIILMDSDEKTAFEIDERSATTGMRTLDYDKLPDFLKHSYQSAVKHRGKEVYVLNLKFLRPFYPPGTSKEVMGPHLFRTLTHEAFHFYFQHAKWAGDLPKLAMTHTALFPVDWKPYYLRYQLAKALKDHYITDSGLGPAAYWHLRSRAFDREYYESLLRHMDRKEGTATYGEAIEFVIKTNGPDFTEELLHEKVKAGSEFFLDAILMMPLSIASYMAGGLSSFILRKEQGREWESKVALQEISPIDYLLEPIAPIAQPDDLEIMKKAQENFEAFNGLNAGAVARFVEGTRSRNKVLLKIPNRLVDRSMMAMNEAYLTPRSDPSITVALGSVRLDLPMPTRKGVSQEFIRYSKLDIGMNFAQDPCRGKSSSWDELGYVILLPKEAIKASGGIEFDDGNLKVNLSKRRYRRKSDSKGRKWLCL